MQHISIIGIVFVVALALVCVAIGFAEHIASRRHDIDRRLRGISRVEKAHEYGRL